VKVCPVATSKARCWFGQRRAYVTAVEGNAVGATTKGALPRKNVAAVRMFRTAKALFRLLPLGAHR